MNDDGFRCKQCHSHLGIFSLKAANIFTCSLCGRVSIINKEYILVQDVGKLNKKIDNLRGKQANLEKRKVELETIFNDLNTKYSNLGGKTREDNLRPAIKQWKNEIKSKRKELDKMITDESLKDEEAVKKIATEINKLSASKIKNELELRNLLDIGKNLRKAENDLARVKRDLNKTIVEISALEGQLRGIEKIQAAEPAPV